MAVRLRDVLAVVLGLAVVGAVAFVGWQWLSDTTEPLLGSEPGADAGATAAAYVEHWAAGEHAAMRDLVRDPPEDFVARHEQLHDGLEATGLEITTGDAREPADGQMLVPVTITVETPVVPEPVAWETELELLRERGDWGVEWSLSTLHPELRPTWSFGWDSSPVGREPILSHDGTELAGTRTQVTFGFQPGQVEDPDEVIEAFAQAFPGSEDVAARELGRGDLNPEWFYPVVTVNEARADRASSTLRSASGILRRTGEGRGLLDEGFAYHIVGIVDRPTAEQLEELGPDADPQQPVGQFGLERVFEDQLTGSELIQVGLVDPSGTVEVVLAEGQEQPSMPVTTTLDVGVQRAVENALVDVDQPAAIVVVDTEDGAIRGSASRPLGGYNRAFSGRYPPGSSFKIVTAEALLATGVVPGDEVTCPAEAVVGGLRVPNAGDRALGTTTLRAAFAASCNTTFAALGAGLGAEALEDAAARFGFGVEPSTPLDAFGGSFPEPADVAELAAASFGQARVEASPLHLASVAAAAGDGTWSQPYLLDDEGPGEQIGLATGVTEPLQELMAAVVTDGTGDAAAVEDAQVLGKTGTAEAQDGVEHAWFVGVWQGLGFAVLVEGGGSGSQVAAPIAGRLVEELVRMSSGDVDPADPDTATPEAGTEVGEDNDASDDEATPLEGDQAADDAAADDGGVPAIEPDEEGTDGGDEGSQQADADEQGDTGQDPDAPDG